MAIQRRMVHHHPSGQRRKLVWATTDSTVAALAAGVATNVQLNSALLANLPGFTVIRTHIRIQIPFVAVTDSTVVGLQVVRFSDVGTARPTLPADQDTDWAYLARYYAQATGAAIDTSREFVIDLRAKRKMEEVSQAYILMIQNNNAAAATYHFFARTLFALP